MISKTLTKFKKKEIHKNNLYVTYVHKSEKFRYPISDVILKRGKKLVKTVFVTVPGNVLL